MTLCKTMSINNKNKYVPSVWQIKLKSLVHEMFTKISIASLTNFSFLFVLRFHLYKTSCTFETDIHKRRKYHFQYLYIGYSLHNYKIDILTSSPQSFIYRENCRQISHYLQSGRMYDIRNIHKLQ